MAERFYINCPLGPGQVELEGPEAHHLAGVCRVRPGDSICLFNGDGREYQAQVLTVGRRNVTLDIFGSQALSRELPISIIVAAPLPKGDRAQFLLEKLTELGVTEFVPLKTKHSVVHPGEAKLEKLQRYVVEASKQCGRNVLLRVHPVIPWKTFCAQPDLPAVKILAHPAGGGRVGKLESGRVGKWESGSVRALESESVRALQSESVGALESESVGVPNRDGVDFPIAPNEAEFPSQSQEPRSNRPAGSHAPTLPHSHSLTLPRSHAATLPPSHAPTLPRSRAPTLSSSPPLPLSHSTVLAAGPEGGFTEEEVNLARKSGWQLVDLGPRILRIETAALFLATWANIQNLSTQSEIH